MIFFSAKYAYTQTYTPTNSEKSKTKIDNNSYQSITLLKPSIPIVKIPSDRP
jgi:hypothetical protein